jgi:hypothetical protein
MAWQQNIPQPTDKLSVSQGDLLNNFQALNTWMNINHYLPTDINSGKHKFVTMPIQGADVATGGNEIALYTKTGDFSAPPQLFWRQQNNGTVVNITEGDLVTNGWSRLPSGLIVKWGSATLSNVGNITYNQGPAFTTVFYVNITPNNSNNAYISITSFNATTANTATTQRTSTTNAINITCTYLVMGI